MENVSNVERGHLVMEDVSNVERGRLAAAWDAVSGIPASVSEKVGQAIPESTLGKVALVGTFAAAVAGAVFGVRHLNAKGEAKQTTWQKWNDKFFTFHGFERGKAILKAVMLVLSALTLGLLPLSMFIVSKGVDRYNARHHVTAKATVSSHLNSIAVKLHLKKA